MSSLPSEGVYIYIPPVEVETPVRVSVPDRSERIPDPARNMSEARGRTVIPFAEYDVSRIDNGHPDRAQVPGYRISF